MKYVAPPPMSVQYIFLKVFKDIRLANQWIAHHADEVLILTVKVVDGSGDISVAYKTSDRDYYLNN